MSKIGDNKCGGNWNMSFDYKFVQRLIIDKFSKERRIVNQKLQYSKIEQVEIDLIVVELLCFLLLLVFYNDR